MKVYTSAQMREREQAAVDAGSSFEQLMENAGCLRVRLRCLVPQDLVGVSLCRAMGRFGGQDCLAKQMKYIIRSQRRFFRQ